VKKLPDSETLNPPKSFSQRKSERYKWTKDRVKKIIKDPPWGGQKKTHVRGTKGDVKRDLLGKRHSKEGAIR